MGEVVLGTAPKENAERDAIHVAVIPGIAGEYLPPGRRVYEVDGEYYKSLSGPGIVDPFLMCGVSKGDRFWLCLLPGTVTGMKHHWTHPAFDNEKKQYKKEESEKWLQNFCETHDCPSYETVMKAIRGEYISFDCIYYSGAYYLDSEYLHFNGQDAHSEIPAEFWDHVRNLIQDYDGPYPSSFSCSC